MTRPSHRSAPPPPRSPKEPSSRPRSLPAKWPPTPTTPASELISNMDGREKAKRRSGIWQRVKKVFCGTRPSTSSSSASSQGQGISVTAASSQVDPVQESPRDSGNRSSGEASTTTSIKMPRMSEGVHDSLFANMVYALADLAVAAPVYALDEDIWSLKVGQNGTRFLSKAPLNSTGTHNVSDTPVTSKASEQPPRIPTPDLGFRVPKHDRDSAYGSCSTMMRENTYHSVFSSSWETVTSEQPGVTSDASRMQVRSRPPHLSFADRRPDASGASIGATWYPGSVMERGIETGPSISGIGWKCNGRQIAHERL